MILPTNKRDWPLEWLFLWDERAAIKEYCGNKPRLQAEFEAEDEIRRMALEEGMLNWESLT